MRELDFRVDVLRKGGKVTELEILSAPSIQLSAEDEIKATMSGEFYPNDDVDWLMDELQPVAIIDGVEHKYGIYSPATYEVDYDAKAVRVEAYDRCWKVKSMTSASRLHFASGAGYISTITSLLLACGITQVISTPSTLTLSTAREDWNIGTSYLDVINTLLEEISYNPLWFNEDGYAVLSPRSDLNGTPKAVYSFKDIMTFAQNAIATVDLFNVPNVFICICDNPDRTAVWTATAENTNPISPTSIIRRGKRITSVVKVNNIASSAELQNYANRLLYEQMLLGESIDITTGILPYCGLNETVAVNHPSVYGICRETDWSVTLEIGGEMVHRLKTVSLNVPKGEEEEDRDIAVAGIAIAGIAIAGRDVA